MSSGEINLQTFETNPAKEIREVSAPRDSDIARETDNSVVETRTAIKKKAMNIKNPSFRSKYNMQCK